MNYFDKAILLIRNPLDATVATFNDFWTGKWNIAYASLHEFEKSNYSHERYFQGFIEYGRIYMIHYCKTDYEVPSSIL